MHILVVDDDPLDRLALRRCLQQSGIPATADEAGGASDTIEQVRASVYDCILLDYYLPGVDTLALLDGIRSEQPLTPIVMFTGRGDEELAVESMKAGAVDYLPKASLTPERLAAAVRYACSVTRSASARRRAESLLQLLNEAAQHLLAAADPVELVHGLFERLKVPLGVDAYSNYLIDDANGALQLASSAGLGEDAAPKTADLSSQSSLSAAVALRREPIQATFIQQSDEPMLRHLKSFGVRACACHPLVAEYELLGTLCFASRSKDEFQADELDFLKTVSHYVTAAYERLRHIWRLREMDRRKDEFLATLAHELRDPLAPLHSMLQVMKRDGADPAMLRRAQATMERQLRQLEQLVDDLRDVNRITHSRLELHMRDVELAPIVQHAVEAARPLAERAGHALTVGVPSAPIHLHADPVRLAQVFGNLLTNACKYTEAGGRISLTAERHGNEVVVIVKDTGIGIPPEQLGTVFEMFSQAPTALARSQGGLGIGLTLVRRLVEMHDGSVEARSEGAGCGSEFVVRLPALDAAQTQLAASAPEPDTSPRRRILVVDDNRDSAMSLAMLLEKMGHVTREAYDGAEAVKAAEEFRPEVVLLDLGLPVLDGYEVCRRIRERPWGGNILIVALTGWGQDEDRRRTQEARFDDHIIKPVHYTALVQLLAEAGGRGDAVRPVP